MEDRAILSVLFGGESCSLEIPPGEVMLGSCETAGIRLPYPGVAAEHCLLRWKKHRLIVEPAGGARVFVNGRRAKDHAEVESGQVLQVGEVGLRFEISGPGIRREPFPRMFLRGAPVEDIPVSEGSLTLGRDPGCEVYLPDADIAPRQVGIELHPEGVSIVALDPAGDTRVNGRHFDRWPLVFGDQLDLGAYHFQFDGRQLRLAGARAGASLVAENLTLSAGGRRILDRVSVGIAECEFVGIIGPTGAGKSTFLGALAGLRPADSGRVLLNGADLHRQFEALRNEFGWVPQADIVHEELTVEQALEFAARLRLPRGTPESERSRLILKTSELLDLGARLGMQIRDLSGGERKKVSVAVELLSRPKLIFLDEPTSGLDPGAAGRLTELLRRLADSGCTVVATTHTMADIQLLDRLIVLSEGMLVFSGPPEDAKSFFGVKAIPGIFPRLIERRAEEWREAFVSLHPEGRVRPTVSSAAGERQRAFRAASQAPVLIARQWAILCSDWRNFAILLGQPLLIGLLLGWAVRGTLDDSALQLFFVGVSILWFGCGNGAQAIVTELPIFRRERMVGLRRSSYLASKWVFTGVLTLLQGALLYGIASFVGAGVVGSEAWQLAGYGVLALLAAAIGLGISAISRSPMQAVLLVPLVIIPQIVLSGYTVPASMMDPLVLAVSEAVPSFQLQRILDMSLLWGRSVDAETIQAHLQAFQNMNEVMHLKVGESCEDAALGATALGVLAAWVVAACGFTFFALRSKEGEC